MRDALEEHPYERRKTPNCTNSSNLSGQFLAEEFSSNPLRTRRSSTIFRYVWEERDTLYLGQINLGTTRASVSRLIKAMYTWTKLHPIQVLISGVLHLKADTGQRKSIQGCQSCSLTTHQATHGQFDEDYFDGPPPVNQLQVQRSSLIDISNVFKNYLRAKLSTMY